MKFNYSKLHKPYKQFITGNNFFDPDKRYAGNNKMKGILKDLYCNQQRLI